MIWRIYVRDNFTGEHREHRPTLDGKPRVFRTLREAQDYAYDYQIAGQRNQDTKFIQVAPRAREG